MDRVTFGKAGLHGWRAKAADVVAAPVAKRSRLSADDVQAAVGVAFFVLSLVHVVGTVKRVAGRAR